MKLCFRPSSFRFVSAADVLQECSANLDQHAPAVAVGNRTEVLEPTHDNARVHADAVGELPDGCLGEVGLRPGDERVQLFLRHEPLARQCVCHLFVLRLVFSGLGALLPGTLLLISPAVGYNAMKLFGCSLMVMAGVVMNRVNVCLLGMLQTSPTGYLPSWIELLVSGGIVAGGLLVLAVMNQNLPIVEPHEESPAPAR